ncbi:hypothetical protein N9Z13_07460 [Luminiphilus sp.]|nr:hypothetical protein [Luminiphilus sp.]MDB2616723.1 hypothetical protein [Luminiphilus sp.]
MRSLFPWSQVASDLAVQNAWAEESKTEIQVGGTTIVVDSQEIAVATLLTVALKTRAIPPRTKDGFEHAYNQSLLMSGVYVDPAEVNDWLRSRFPFEWLPNSKQSGVTKFAQQEDMILDEIRSLGEDWMALPRTRGKPGIKSRIWARCRQTRQLFPSKEAFDKAWLRLRKDGRIADAA